ncbi:MAG: cytochrome c maturation protein CcmE [Rhodospirillaceae bacterium]|nr:cytochrome c maturation protein CcmE [Rhodospirillaceae bacterium]|tara:strand:+ start:4145 stop:4588 length:444 start_codon:yes stop_codon:yes gene_type:complete
MTPTRRRLLFVGLGLSSLVTALLLALNAFEENLVFFYSPSDLTETLMSSQRPMRIGGLVKKGSVKRSDDGLTIRFEVTDLQKSMPTIFNGALPDLFSENQGIVAEGRIIDGIFRANKILAKHDENYMPKEVAEALRKSGKWKGPEKK